MLSPAACIIRGSLGSKLCSVHLANHHHHHIWAIALQKKFRIGHSLLILLDVSSLFHLLFSFELQSVSKSIILQSTFALFMYTYIHIQKPVYSFPTSLKMVLNIWPEFNYLWHPHLYLGCRIFCEERRSGHIKLTALDHRRMNW